MSSEVWYRKWRPRSFAEITGEEHVTRTLRNAVAQGRVAHAYLLCGPRGTGKTTTARVLAKAVNCSRPTEGEPCNACESCLAVAEGRALDLVEMDAASNRGIDDIRSLRDRVGYHPTAGAYRVYLIDEVHELTAQAFDALLKTLEEPPAHIIFLLATTDAHKVPATIISRCQRFDLVRVRQAEIAARLAFIAEHEGVTVEPGALDAVARAATGSLRDAVNLLEQLVATYGSPLIARQAGEGLGLISDDRARDLAVLAVQGDLADGLSLIAAVQDDGVDLRGFQREVLAQLRALLLVKSGAEAGLDGFSADTIAALRRTAAPLDLRRIVRALRAFGGADTGRDAQPALGLELALADVALLADAEPARERPTPAPPNGMARPAPRPEASSPQPAPTVVPTPARTAEPAPAPERAPEIAVASEAPAHTAVGLEAHTLEDVRTHFRGIYLALGAIHRPTAGYLNSGCDIVAFDGRTLTFGFAHAWLTERLLPGTQAHRHLSGAVEQVLGRRVEVQCVHVAGVIDRLKASPARPSHLLDEAKKLGLQVVDRH
ncbi:MAG: DNA polymerase III subunit gamma/tau [Dehalococcoidia bacterium]